MNQWHVATAAEAIAAAQFARCGWDVLVQYGANLPEYDLVAVKSPHTIKVSVKGSQEGGWGLTQSHLKDKNYHGAVDIWLARHSSETIMCFVQFENVAINEMPRVYLATPLEVADWLKASAKGRGDTVLREHHVWGIRAQAAGTTDQIPCSWQFTSKRVSELASGA